MGLVTAKATLKTIRDAVKKENCIYAIERCGHIDMLDEKYPDIKSLKAAAKKYIKSGFKVHYTMVVT
jgi:hypothetical protein